MAKKKIQLRMALNSNIRIAVSDDAAKTLSEELSAGSASLSISMSYGSGTEYMRSIYSDHFKTGGFNITQNAAGFLDISIVGEIFEDLDVKFHKEFISELEKVGELQIKCSEISDSNVDSYYIDGDDKKTVVIGVCGLSV